MKQNFFSFLLLGLILVPISAMWCQEDDKRDIDEALSACDRVFSDNRKDAEWCRSRAVASYNSHLLGEDCVECFMPPPRPSGWEHVTNLIGALAPPLASLGSNIFWSNAYKDVENGRIDAFIANSEQNAQNYQAGINACLARFNAYLGYTENVGMNPLLPEEANAFGCNGLGLGSYAGMNPYMSNGMGGIGTNPYLAAGYSSPFISGMMGPFGQLGINVGGLYGMGGMPGMAGGAMGGMPGMAGGAMGGVPGMAGGAMGGMPGMGGVLGGGLGFIGGFSPPRLPGMIPGIAGGSGMMGGVGLMGGGLAGGVGVNGIPNWGGAGMGIGGNWGGALVGAGSPIWNAFQGTVPMNTGGGSYYNYNNSLPFPYGSGGIVMGGGVGGINGGGSAVISAQDQALTERYQQNLQVTPIASQQYLLDIMRSNSNFQGQQQGGFSGFSGGGMGISPFGLPGLQAQFGLGIYAY